MDPTRPSQMEPWVAAPIVDRDGELSLVDVPLAPDPAGRTLAVTVSFDASSVGFIRLFWHDAQQSVMLSSDLREGMQIAGQKTLLLPSSLLLTPGLLSIQSTGSRSPVVSISLEWTQAEMVQVTAGAPVPLVVQPGGQVIPKEMPASPEDFWRGPIVSAPLIEGSQEMDGPLRIGADLEEIPARARFECWVGGLPPDAILHLHINGADPLLAVPETPALEQPGWFQKEDQSWCYAGWRKLSLWLPAHLLSTGPLDLLLVPSYSAQPRLWAIKDAVLQLDYPSTESGPSEQVPAAHPTSASLPLTTLPLNPAEAPLPEKDL